MNDTSKNIAQDKAEKQFIEAYDLYADSLFRFCFFRIHSREQAKDITQEIFTKTWDYIRKGNQIKHIKAFLYTTARHLIIDHVRKRKEQSLEYLQENGFDQSVKPSQIQDLETQTALEAIHKLDEKYRDVLLMRHIDGFSPKEIAKMLVESENAVSVRIHRGLALLREMLKTKN
jgi:RNA polymerase sigma-70 factor (ECF subfamily)